MHCQLPIHFKKERHPGLIHLFGVGPPNRLGHHLPHRPPHFFKIHQPESHGLVVLRGFLQYDAEDIHIGAEQRHDIRQILDQGRRVDEESHVECAVRNTQEPLGGGTILQDAPEDLETDGFDATRVLPGEFPTGVDV